MLPNRFSSHRNSWRLKIHFTGWPGSSLEMVSRTAYSLSLTYFIMSMTQDQAKPDILVIRLSSMGDVILASAVVESLIRDVPGCQITMVTADTWRGLWLDDPRFVRVLTITAAQNADLGATDWDRIVDLQNSRKSRALVAKLKSRRPVRKFNKLHLSRFLLLALRINTYPPESNVIQRYHHAAGLEIGPAGGETRLICSPRLAARCRQTFLSFVPQGVPLLGLFPFSAWKNKQWPLYRFAAVASAFVERGWAVAIFGGAEDREAAQRLAQRVGAPLCYSIAGQTSVAESVASVGLCSLALGGDSGLSHMARACGVPTGMIFGATSRHLGFYPVGQPLGRIFETPLWCRPCHAHGGNICFRGGRPCLARISVEAVVKGLLEISRHSESGAQP